jgi:hypothetical protein
LQDRWKIEGPQTTWEKEEEESWSETCGSETFLLEYTVSDFIQYPQYEILRTGCEEEHPDEQALMSLATMELVQDDTAADSQEHSQQKVLLEFSPENTTKHGKAPLEFCLKLALWTGPVDTADAVQVNFRETNIRVTFQKKNSDDMIGIESVYLEPRALRSAKVQLPGAGITCGGESCKQSAPEKGWKLW